MEINGQSSYDFQASAESHEQSRKLEGILRHLRFMSMANEAMLEILTERVGVTEEELRRKMAEIDARDTRRDGRMSSMPSPCKKCGQTVDSSKVMCLYCGEPVDAGEFFESPFF